MTLHGYGMEVFFVGLGIGAVLTLIIFAIFLWLTGPSEKEETTD